MAGRKKSARKRRKRKLIVFDNRGCGSGGGNRGILFL